MKKRPHKQGNIGQQDILGVVIGNLSRCKVHTNATYMEILRALGVCGSDDVGIGIPRYGSQYDRPCQIHGCMISLFLLRDFEARFRSEQMHVIVLLGEINPTHMCVRQ
jgi:hypothetical protein